MYSQQPQPSLLKIIYLAETNKFEKVSKQSDDLLMGDYEKYLDIMSKYNE